MEYKIGQILISEEEQVLEKCFGEKVVIPKGNKVIIGADNLAHHIKNGMIQPLNKEDIVSGHDAEGIAYYLGKFLLNRFPIEEILIDYDISVMEFTNEIQYALEEIGF